MKVVRFLQRRYTEAVRLHKASHEEIPGEVQFHCAGQLLHDARSTSTTAPHSRRVVLSKYRHAYLSRYRQYPGESLEFDKLDIQPVRHLALVRD